MLGNRDWLVGRDIGDGDQAFSTEFGHVFGGIMCNFWGKSRVCLSQLARDDGLGGITMESKSLHQAGDKIMIDGYNFPPINLRIDPTQHLFERNCIEELKSFAI